MSRNFRTGPARHGMGGRPSPNRPRIRAYTAVGFGLVALTLASLATIGFYEPLQELMRTFGIGCSTETFFPPTLSENYQNVVRSPVLDTNRFSITHPREGDYFVTFNPKTGVYELRTVKLQAGEEYMWEWVVGGTSEKILVKIEERGPKVKREICP